MNAKYYTILVVDDNPDLLELLQESLASQFTLFIAHDGIEGLICASESAIDCAIIDIKMPGLDGLQLVRALRGDPATQAIPLILLSAMPIEQGKVPGLMSGTDLYLTKPILPSELIAAIYAVIALSQQDRTVRLRTLVEEGDH